MGYGSLRSASFAKIATLNAIEIAKCADEQSGSFCIKNYEKRLRDLDLGSSGGFFNPFQESRDIKDDSFFQKNIPDFEIPYQYFAQCVKAARFTSLE